MDTRNKNGNTATKLPHNHYGHRMRLKERYAREKNFDNFQPHEVLELLLFYVIPQRDTNAIAHELIDRFGSLEAVLNAPLKELEKVPWIKGSASLYLSLFNNLERFRQMNNDDLPDVLNSSEKIIEYIKPQYYGETTEVSRLICLSRDCRVLGCHKILEGTISYTSLNPRNIIDVVFRCNAPCVVLVHNHPVGSPMPSQNDVETTRSLIRLLSQIEVKVIDHIIISPAGECSMARMPKYMMMFE